MYYWYAAVCAADSRSGPSIARTGAGWSRSRFRLTRVLSLVEAPKTLEMSVFFVQGVGLQNETDGKEQSGVC